jgi:hypothetical protein
MNPNDRSGSATPDSPEIRFSEFGGATVGRVNWTWPFGRLVVTSQHLTLRVPGSTFVFPRDKVKSLRTLRFPLARGLQISHRLDGVAEQIVYFSWRPGRLMERLKEMDYEVE